MNLIFSGAKPIIGKLAILLATTLLAVGCGSTKKATDYNVVAYYPSYKASSTPLSDEVLSMITHVNLSFAKVGADGSVRDRAVRESMHVFGPKAKAAGVKVLVSVGGGGGHNKQVAFATAIHDSLSRATLVDNLMRLCDEAALDGLDIDYEAWGVGEVASDLVLEKDLEVFLQMLRARLGNKLLTAAVADYGRYNSVMAGCFDYITVMAYDLTGPWSKNAGPHSPFEFFVSAIEHFESYGFSKSQIVGGVPFYGRGYPDADTKKAYEMTYSRIVDMYPGAENQNVINDELYYDGFPAIDEKCRFVVENGLGGIMFWEVTGDSADPEKSLLCRITKNLR